MVAFMSWYAIPPLVDYIAQDLGISSVQVYDSNMAAVSVTVCKSFFPFIITDAAKFFLCLRSDTSGSGSSL